MKSQTIVLSKSSRQPIVLDNLITPETEQISLIVEAGVELTCLDTRSIVLENISLTITVNENAQLTYCDHRHFDAKVPVKNCITFSIACRGRITFEQWQEGSKKVCTTINAHLIGNNAEADLRLGARLAQTNTHEVKTFQHHEAAHTKSRCIIKTLVAEKAESHYEGMIIVETTAHHTEAFLDHRALLLSDKAQAYAQPSLEVHTDEVQCGHGSAIGQIDKEQLFYLQARGILPTVAQELLQNAFIDELYETKIMKKVV